MDLFKHSVVNWVLYLDHHWTRWKVQKGLCQTINWPCNNHSASLQFSGAISNREFRRPQGVSLTVILKDHRSSPWKLLVEILSVRNTTNVLSKVWYCHTHLWVYSFLIWRHSSAIWQDPGVSTCIPVWRVSFETARSKQASAVHLVSLKQYRPRLNPLKPNSEGKLSKPQRSVFSCWLFFGTRAWISLDHETD